MDAEIKSSDDDSVVIRSLENGVLTLTLNRPASMNAFVLDMAKLLSEYLQEAAENNRVGAVILSGAGKNFCAGGNMHALLEMANEGCSPDELMERLRLVAKPGLLLSQIGKPTIAMMRGATAGGGLSLAAACDIRIVSDNSRLTFAYTKIGLSGDLGANVHLTRVLGLAKALEFCMLSPVIGAEQAYSIGLANRVVADHQLEQETYDLARALVQTPTRAKGAIKENLLAAISMPASDAIEVEARNFVQCQRTKDHREAVLAFIEKRVPNFSGT
jgi:2-(1,2-epoxy-1,2-dihydrophenyl)acetyl-CoA isomerase